MGCAGRVANGINTVHLSYVRERTGHALIGARQWIPAEYLADPRTAAGMGLPPGMQFRTKGQLAMDVCADAYADGLVFDVVCGDEVYGNCTPLREFFETRGQAYVLRVASTIMIDLPSGDRLTCAQAVTLLAAGTRRWEVRSAGTGSKGQRWYAWAWIATASPRHHLLVRRHLSAGELAFHYCHVPEGQPVTKTRLIRAAGLRWPVEECFEFGKDYFGLDQCQARLYTPIARHTVLVMAALAVCAVTAAHLRGPYRPPSPAPEHTGPATTARARTDPTDRARGQAATRRRPSRSDAARPCHPLAHLATPPPGTRTLVPPTHTTEPRVRPGQLAIGGCRTR
jgi:SRSO17 transposase